MECCCYLRKAPDHFADGKTPYERRFGEPCERPIIPFGAMVEYFPISAKEKSRLHQFGEKVSPRMFTGYASVAERIWKGDMLVVVIEEVRKLDASEIHARRLNAKERKTSKQGRTFHIHNRRRHGQIAWKRS